MGKKYLDTKKNTLEDAVLEVFIKESVLAGRDYKYDGKGPIKISKKMYGKVKKDSKSMIKGKPYMMALNPKTQGTELVPVKFEEVELDEKQNTYTVVHIKKGKEIIKAKSSYEAAKKFAQMKRLKNTAGVDAYIMEEVEIHEQTQFQVVYTNKKSSDKGLYRLEKDRTLGKIYNQREAEKMIKKLSADKRNSDFEYRFVPKGNINRSGEVVTPVDFYKVGFKNRKEQVSSPSKYIDILNKLREETEYQKFFKSAMKKFGVKSPSELDGDKEKEFYDYVDKNWKGKNEPKEVGEKRKPNGKTLTGKPKDNIDVNPKTSDIKAGKY